MATGQTTCWNPFANIPPIAEVNCDGTGQDGEFQAGLLRSYTDNGDGTITDNVTGLVWEKLLPANDVGRNCAAANRAERDPSCVNNGYTWTEAFEKIAALNAACGGCGWRLPNVNELQSIVDYGRFSPSIHPTFGPTSASSSYWSSTTLVNFPEVAWFVGFSNGSVFFGNKPGSLFVRGVRGGSSSISD